MRVDRLDAANWEDLHHAFAPHLRRVIERYVSRDAVDDVMQETLLRAYRNRHLVDPQRPIGPWLATIARRAAIDAVRRDRARQAAEARVGASPVSADPVGDECLNAVRRENVRRALEGLTPRHRSLVAHELQGTKRQTLAAADGTTGTGLKSAMARARANFRVRYIRISEETGVFGAGGVVGRRLLAVRLRMQRVLAVVSEQGVTAGVAVVSVALMTFPAWARDQERAVDAQTGRRSTMLAVHMGTMPLGIGPSTPGGSAISNPSGAEETRLPASAPGAATGVGPDMRIASEATVGADHDRATVSLYTRVTIGGTDTRDSTESDVECGHRVGAAGCAAIGLLPPVDSSQEHVGAGAQGEN